MSLGQVVAGFWAPGFPQVPVGNLVENRPDLWKNARVLWATRPIEKYFGERRELSLCMPPDIA